MTEEKKVAGKSARRVDGIAKVTGAARYTVQVHNIGEYNVRVTIGRLIDVSVPQNGWRFREVRFRPSATYPVRAIAPQHGLAWDAALTSR